VKGEGVGPLSGEGLDEAFSFAIGAGAVGLGAGVFDAEEMADVLEGFGDVTGTVVGEDPLSRDTVLFEPRDGAPKKRGCCGSSFISEHLRIGESRGIIDGDVNVLPTDRACPMKCVRGGSA
jgi:hypothetical protein